MKFIKRIQNSIMRSHKYEALNYLQSMTPAQLSERGFSAAMVDQGVKAWPWREDNEATGLTTIEILIAEEQRCVNELKKYTDTELADLGLCRGSIRDSVRHGRPGIDNRDFRQAA